MEVATDDIRHGATAALAAAHLCLQPEVDLHGVDPGFPPEVLERVNIGDLIFNFNAIAHAIAIVVSIEQVI